MRQYLILALAGILLTACNSNEPTAEIVDDQEVSTAPTPNITLEPKTPGIDFPEATITKWSYENGSFDYDYDADTYELGAQSPDAGSTMCANSAKGQHIHLIVDNQPYIAKYEPEFEQALDDGEHHVLTFLSRSYHESIKSDNAHRAERVTVANGGFTSASAITEPMLFYSRPKGTYVGDDTKEILLDFYPVNAALGSNYKVKVEVGDATFTVDKWQPYVLRGLPMGDNTVTLTLVDDAGRRVDAPLNPVSRTFTLSADPMG